MRKFGNLLLFEDSAFRTVAVHGVRTVMCSPVRASQIAHALKLPRVSVVRRLEELIKHGYVERVGNAYRVTDKVNIPELQKKLQRRIDMVGETAKKLAEVGGSLPHHERIRSHCCPIRNGARQWWKG